MGTSPERNLELTGENLSFAYDNDLQTSTHSIHSSGHGLSTDPTTYINTLGTLMTSAIITDAKSVGSTLVDIDRKACLDQSENLHNNSS